MPNPLTDDDNEPRDLGSVQHDINTLRQRLKHVDDRTEFFLTTCVSEIASLVHRGLLDKQAGVDALEQMARDYGVTEELGEDVVTRIIGNAMTAKPALVGLDCEVAKTVRRMEMAHPIDRLKHVQALNGHDEADDAADDAGENESVSLDDFCAYMPLHCYIFTPSREMWPASVNARIAPVPAIDADGKPVLDKKGEPKMIPASTWLDQNKPVEQMTWAPGLPTIVCDRLIADGGWIERKGVSCFNLYRAPTIKPGDATKAGRWLDHVHRVFGDDADHIVQWLAHRVQRPEVKINHALVFGGAQGIGKDTLLEPVKQAIGSWNFSEVSPQQMLGRFNGFFKSVILRISEARDLGEADRFAFYEHTKSATAAPPDVHRIDEKHLKEYYIPNVCGVIITTNHKVNGIYLPADDRRHFVAWSDLTKEDFSPAYWNALWGWYASGGIRHVTAYLTTLDLGAFDPKKPPPKTPAFWAIADANRAPEDAELADVLDLMGNPDATTLTKITASASGDIEVWIRDRKNRRAIPHRLEQCGYEPVRNDAAIDGLWKISGKRQVAYAAKRLSLRDRIEAVRRMT